MRRTIPALALLALAACSSDPEPVRSAETSTDARVAPESGAPAGAPSAPDLRPLDDVPLRTLEGEPTSLAAFDGEALLIVNVASRCGLTPQYAKLEELQETYGPRGFSVVGFPCNQFGAQEPGSPAEIRSFCESSYGVSFPLMEKIEVNGSGRHPLYQRLTAVPDAKGEAGDVQWNFEKFVVSADGARITRFRPRTSPDDPALIAAIESALPR
jgi:glutathione peroxidase